MFRIDKGIRPLPLPTDSQEDEGGWSNWQTAQICGQVFERETVSGSGEWGHLGALASAVRNTPGLRAESSVLCHFYTRLGEDAGCLDQGTGGEGGCGSQGSEEVQGMLLL